MTAGSPPYRPLPGQATAEGTRRYFARVKPGFEPRELGNTGLQVAAAGFGTYRVTDQDPAHREALKQALETGCNLIDTSTNYMDGASERLVGEVLRDLVANERLTRDEIVVVTKVGYAQGRTLREARERDDSGQGFTEMNRLTPDLWHCVSPDFLEHQITRSLERLGLERVDFLLLHNPEYFLKHSGDHAEYYRRIGNAFMHLEKEIQRGRIGAYGVSSNTFPVDREDADFTSLEVVLDRARDAGQGFRVIQFPFNLLEPGAALGAHAGSKSLLEVAREAGVGTLINRPLNAFAANRMVRLADFPETQELDLPGTVSKRMNELVATETRFTAKDVVPMKALAWGHLLAHHWSQVTDIDFWRQVLRHQILPQIAQALPRVAERDPEWAREYDTRSQALFASITTLLEAQANEQVAPLREAIERELSASVPRVSFAQLAMRLYRSIPGVDCVLIGMRHPGYVQDVLAGLGMPEWPAQDARRALEHALEAWQASPPSRSPEANA